MTDTERAHSDDHQPWYIDMDDGFNLMLSSGRPKLVSNSPRWYKTLDATAKATKLGSEISDNKDKNNNTTNNTQTSSQSNESNTQNKPKVDSIWTYQVYYPTNNGEPSIDITVVGNKKIDSVVNNTFTGNRPQKKVLKLKLKKHENGSQ